MNETYELSSWAIDSVSSYFGITSAVFQILLPVSIILGVILGIYIFFRSILFATLSGMVVTIIFSITGWLPLSITIGYMLISAITIGFILFNVPSEPQTEDKEVNISTWDNYGQLIKDAYAAKFGGVNNGFNQEVDTRIRIMNHNGRGFTRTIAYDWLKRMKKFTEAK